MQYKLNIIREIIYLKLVKITVWNHLLGAEADDSPL